MKAVKPVKIFREFKIPPNCVLVEHSETAGILKENVLSRLEAHRWCAIPFSEISSYQLGVNLQASTSITTAPDGFQAFLTRQKYYVLNLV